MRIRERLHRPAAVLGKEQTGGHFVKKKKDMPGYYGKNVVRNAQRIFLRERQKEKERVVGDKVEGNLVPGTKAENHTDE